MTPTAETFTRPDGLTVTLYMGDCLDVLPTLAAGSVDAVITDPPWNMGYFENDSKPWSEYSSWLAAVLVELSRIYSRGIFVFQSSKAITYVSSVFAGYEAFASVKNFSQMNKHNLPNAWDIAFYKVVSGYVGNGRNWNIANTAGMLAERTEHPTPRTIDTMEYIVSMFDWALIADPFMGSGTTGVAAVKLGRSFIGIEKEPKYYEIARRRILEALAQPALFQVA